MVVLVDIKVHAHWQVYHIDILPPIIDKSFNFCSEVCCFQCVTVGIIVCEIDL